VRREELSPHQLDVLLASFEAIEKCCESPIEYAFGVAAAIALSNSGLRLVPQYRLGPYRYDFAVLPPKAADVLAFVECDGKEFHSTPEQLANDRKKDAAAIEAGAIIVRFSGSAIAKEPERCAADLMGRIRLAWMIA
jgi:very-short-patch-repair endonuclease